MNRRKFLLSSAGLIGSSVIGRNCFGQAAAPGLASNFPVTAVPGRLKIALDSAPRLVPANYLGLSYELAQLTDPNFFAATNRDLVTLFRLLSPRGVLRLGGNSSESCWLKVEAATTAPELPPVAGPVSEHWMPRQLFMIPPEAIGQLAGFLRVTGWQLVYGLNFGHSSPDRLARSVEWSARLVNACRRAGVPITTTGTEPDPHLGRARPTTAAVDGWEWRFVLCCVVVVFFTH